MTHRFVRFSTEKSDVNGYGQLDNGQVTVLDAAPWFDGKPTGEVIAESDATLLAPVEPSKIVCIGLNYHAHVKASYSADEAPDHPLICFKPPSSRVGPGADIVHPEQSQRVDYEAELGVVIGRTARNIAEDVAADHIFGFTCVNDVTARDLQKVDGQWSRAKGFDTFCPVGPWIVSDYDYADVLIEAVHNDTIAQSGRTAQMIFNVPFLISYISTVMTLNPGDLIATGTPSGIAPMKPGDSIVVRIQRIGELENRIVGS